jgi:hypothetical protein
MKGQVLLITVFTLTFALFSIFILLAPIKDKLLRIKEMENVYQAISNSEKGLEAGLLDFFKNVNLALDKNSTSSPNTDCGGLRWLIGPSINATCIKITYTPTTTGNYWPNNRLFVNNTFVLRTVSDSELKIFINSISDGYSGRSIRTIIIGPSR